MCHPLWCYLQVKNSGYRHQDSDSNHCSASHAFFWYLYKFTNKSDNNKKKKKIRNTDSNKKKIVTNNTTYKENAAMLLACEIWKIIPLLFKIVFM